MLIKSSLSLRNMNDDDAHKCRYFFLFYLIYNLNQSFGLGTESDVTLSKKKVEGINVN